MGMAMFMDPVLQLQQSPIGVLASWCSGLVFLGMGLHLKFIEGIAYSFHWIPPGQAGSVAPTAPLLLEATQLAILVGFQLSGPLLVLVLLVNTFIGIMAKLAPKMNMFFSIHLEEIVTITGAGDYLQCTKSAAEKKETEEATEKGGGGGGAD